jgi:3-phenylpropionate/trans-cinnamate dioxygenase ferredoxin subunit
VGRLHGTPLNFRNGKEKKSGQMQSKLPPGMKRYVVARADEIPEGGRTIVEAGGREIGIYKLKGRFHALLNRCPHLGGPLCKGGVVSEIYAPVPGDVRGDASKLFVTCPWHNWEFDVETGQSYWSPKGPRARLFPVNVEHGETVATALEGGTAERVPGPYKAEVVPVSVESDYIVIAMRPSPSARAAEPVTPSERAS